MTTYAIKEHGPHWIVSVANHEMARYRKDEIAWNGYTDTAELKREIRQNLNLKRSDRVIVKD